MKHFRESIEIQNVSAKRFITRSLALTGWVGSFTNKLCVLGGEEGGGGAQAKGDWPSNITLSVVRRRATVPLLIQGNAHDVVKEFGLSL